jgi:hypothetical protein
VLAYAIGEESFADAGHGTNIYQAGDPYQDLGNVVKSPEFDGLYNPATDEIVSLSDLGGSAGGSSCTTSFDLTVYPDFAFNPTVPNQPNTCDGQWSGKTYVRRAVETVYSTDAASPLILDKSLLDSTCRPYATYDNPPTWPNSAVNVYRASDNAVLYVGPNQTGSFQLLAADANPVRINPMAAGSTVNASPGNTGLAVANIASGQSGQFTYGSTPDAQPVTVNYTFGTTTLNNVTTVNSSGTVTVSFKSVGGLVTNVTLSLVRSSPPSTCP